MAAAAAASSPPRCCSSSSPTSPRRPFKQLLVGTETGDDAAVWQVDDNTCVIATTDFFMPMVDDPFDFGRIAATNAISDVYAMGGKPIMALAILGMPVDKIPVEMVREILKGGAAVCGNAGIPVAGGHSIDCPEPVYGLAVIGTCHPSQVRRNSEAKAGDALILTKPVGVGIYSAAIKKSALPPAAYEEMIATTTMLNRIGAELGKDKDVHAVTDVTGFGVLGHALEWRAAPSCPSCCADDVPLLQEAACCRSRGSSPARRIATGRATAMTWSCRRYAGMEAPSADRPADLGRLAGRLRAERAASILQTIVAAGYPFARRIGHAEAGSPKVQIVA